MEKYFASVAVHTHTPSLRTYAESQKRFEEEEPNRNETEIVHTAQ